jgi:3',5'-cyclic AMP phosphodiesterase CpdA
MMSGLNWEELNTAPADAFRALTAIGRRVRLVAALAGFLLWTGGRASLGAEPAPPLAKTLTVVQVCDPQIGLVEYAADLSRFEKAVGQINALSPDFVFICGDLVQTPSRKAFSDFLAAKTQFRAPCYCAPGNHDVGEVPTAASLALYRECIGRDYFSLDHGDCAFVFVNTQLWKAEVPGESEKHDAWFRTTLEAAAAKGRRIFVVGHIPVFSVTPDEPDGHDNLPLKKRGEILEACRRCGVQAYLAGHSHRARSADYFGMQVVQSETTSMNFDLRPWGFRVWHIGATRPYAHEFVMLRLGAGAPATNAPAGTNLAPALKAP